VGTGVIAAGDEWEGWRIGFWLYVLVLEGFLWLPMYILGRHELWRLNCMMCLMHWLHMGESSLVRYSVSARNNLEHAYSCAHGKLDTNVLFLAKET
jgi:hypothetical protein